MIEEQEFDLEAMDLWYTEHFKELVDRYAGKVIAMVDGEVVAVTNTEREADQIARSAYPHAVPLVVAIPREEELICLSS